MQRNLLAIFLATIAFTLWGYVWYATIFDDVWQELIQTSEAELIELAVSRGTLQDIFTYLINLAQVLGIFIMLRWSRASTFLSHIKVSLVLSVLIVLPALGNATLFAGTPTFLLLLDFGHFFLGYSGIAFTVFLISRKRDENLELKKPQIIEWS